MIASGLLKLSDFGFATFLAKGEKTTEDVGTPASGLRLMGDVGKAPSGSQSRIPLIVRHSIPRPLL